MLCSLLLATGCASAPFDYPREASIAVLATGDTLLGREVRDWRAENPGPSGFYPLIQGRDALGTRLRLMELAEKRGLQPTVLLSGDEGVALVSNHPRFP